MSDTIPAELAGLHNVSDAWKVKFQLLERIGADKVFLYAAMRSDAYKQLGFRDRYKVTQNIGAFLFGPLYYFAKGMWAKGAVLLAATWVLAALLSCVESVVGVDLPGVVYWVPSAVLCGQLANFDYFRKVTQGETMWPGTPSALRKPAAVIALPLLALFLLGAVIMWSPATKTQMLEDVSGVWRGDTDGAMVTLSLARKTKTVRINGNEIPVTIKSIDRDNHVVTLDVRLRDGQQASWAVQQLFKDNGRFTLQFTLHDGTQDTLSFVRNL